LGISDGEELRGHQSGINKASGNLSYQAWIGTGQIREHYYREAVVGISGDIASEALPRTAMFDAFVFLLLTNAPTKSVSSRVWLSVVQRIYRPYAV
jgi:hypothetical protein